MQLQEKLYNDIDWIASTEDKLEESLPDAEIDGHDIGSGEINIFIHTNDPLNTFKMAKNVLEEGGLDLENIKMAYRELSSEKYIPLWPENLVDFNVA